MVKKINKSIGVFFPFFFCFIGLFSFWVSHGGMVVIHLFGFLHQKLTENIGETWGSFFLPFSFFFL